MNEGMVWELVRMSAVALGMSAVAVAALLPCAHNSPGNEEDACESPLALAVKLGTKDEY
jgi:hypothetical protein